MLNFLMSAKKFSKSPSLNKREECLLHKKSDYSKKIIRAFLTDSNWGREAGKLESFYVGQYDIFGAK